MSSDFCVTRNLQVIINHRTQIDATVEVMDEKPTHTSNVESVLRCVTFYSPPRNDNHLTALLESQKSSAVRNDSSRIESCDVQVQKRNMLAQTSTDSGKSKMSERCLKSIEGGRISKSKNKLSYKQSKCSLLPYKRGQLKFCAQSGNVEIRNQKQLLLNSAVVTDKENKTNDRKANSDMHGNTSRRFFKASFTKRRPFTVSVCSSAGNQRKLNFLKHFVSSNAPGKDKLSGASSEGPCLGSKQKPCETDSRIVSDFNSAVETCDVERTNSEMAAGCEAVAEVDRNQIDSTDEKCDSGHADNEMATESEAVAEADSNQLYSDTDSESVNDCSGLAGAESCLSAARVSTVGDSPVPNSTSNHTSAPTSSSQNRGLRLSPFLISSNKRKCEENTQRLAKKEKEQMLLDFGQKLHETINCGVCGMTYIRCEPVDELTHSQYHQTLFATLKFTGWRKSAVVHDFEDGSCCVAVSCDDKRSCRRVGEIKKLVDRELGYIVEGSLSSHSKTYLYISGTQVVGFCLAQHITHGFRLLPAGDGDAEDQRSRSRSCCCSEDPVPARCGISRIWVLASERRKHVASRLLDVVRGHFLMGYPVNKEELAFSDPTPDGIRFAAGYTGTSAFLVYKTAG